MTTNHIDQLAEWWDSAEDAPASPGDRIIERHVCERDGDTYYTVGVHREGMRGLIGKSGTRILARAPIPKPAWHDAVAVIARRESPYGLTPRKVFSRRGSNAPQWESNGYYANTEDLIDPVPLIEAKVTDEMVERGWSAYWGPTYGGSVDERVRAILTAALGLEAT